MKTAFITGGTRGIGRATCIKLANDGYNIAFTYASNKDMADELAQELSDAGVKAAAYCCNLGNPQQIEEVCKAVIADFGSVDVLVNNAGQTKDGLLIRMSEEDFSAVIDVNLKGTFLVTKYIAANMAKQRKGSIINLTSIIGIMGNAGQCNYAASKAALIGFTKSLARELGGRGIRVNAIAPGFIVTDMTDKLKDEQKDAMLNNTALKRLGDPTDIANTVAFLASDNASYITAQTIVVDGGVL